MSTTEIAPEHSARNVEQEVMLLPIHLLTPSNLNPRRDFDEEKMSSLRDSMRMFGIITPLTVRKVDDENYEIVAGERRFRAASDIALDFVPVVVRDVTDRQLVEMAMDENAEREPLTAIDDAYAFSTLVSLGATQEDIARRIRKDVSYVSNTMRLLKLPKTFQGLIACGELTRAHGIAICGLAVAGLGTELGQLVARTQSENLTSRQVEQEVARIKSAHEEALQPRLDTTEPLPLPSNHERATSTVMQALDASTRRDSAPTTPAASSPSVAAQAELTPEGDVVFTGNTTSPSGVETAPTVEETAPMVSPPAVAVVDRRSSATVAPETQSAPAAAPTPAAPLTPAAPATASAGSAPSPPAAPAAAPQASAPSGAMVACTIPSALDDWLWDAGFDNVTQALELMRLLGDAATRRGKTLKAFIDTIIEEN